MIQVPEAVLGIKKWECEVVSNHNVATFIKEFVVRLPEGETLDFQSGGYVQIDVPKLSVNFKDMDIEEVGRAPARTPEVCYGLHEQFSATREHFLYRAG